MNEEPKSIWKKSWRGPHWLYVWVIIVAVIFFIALMVCQFIPGGRQTPAGDLLGGSLILATVVAGLWTFVRWLLRGRNFIRFVFVCACFITLIALFYAEEDWRGKHDWEKFKAQWEAKGETFDYAGVIPPPVPDDQNMAMVPIWVESMKAVLGATNSVRWFGNNYAENGRSNFVDRLEMPLTRDYSESPTNGNWARGTLTDLTAWQNYYRDLAATTNLFPVAPQPQTPAQDVLLALSKYDSTIEELRKAGQRPYSRFPLYSDPGHPFDMLLPHLATLKQCSQVLRLRAIAELQNNQTDQALADVKLMLRLIDAARTEPDLISHLVRIALMQSALQPVYEGLAKHKWSGMQLDELDAELAKFDFLVDYGSAMRGERACEISSQDYLRRTRNLNAAFDAPPPPERWRILSHLIMPDAFFYQNELTIARMQQQFILPMVNLEERTVSPTKVQQSQNQADKELQHWSPCTIFARMLLPGIENAVVKFAYAQEAVDLARVAIALERYRLAHGEYPVSLDVLAPQFIAKLPHDIINGQPLHYRRTADGQFVLYSVGWNETDDGGEVGLAKNGMLNNQKGDWVWRYPAN